MTNPHYQRVHEYLTFCRMAFARTASGGTVRLFWSSSDFDAAGWRREFVAALLRRIDIKGGTVRSGRKFDSDYQRHMFYDGRAINRASHAPGKTSIICRRSQITTDNWRERFAHVYTEN